VRAGPRRGTIAAALLAQLAVVVVAGACGRTGLNPSAAPEPPEAAACGLSTCSGCCDPNGDCVAGTSADACGSGGIACGTCGATEECTAGLCLECGPTTCAGCCAAGRCQPGTTQAVCGSQGSVCQACPAASTCSGGSCLAGAIVLFGGEGSASQLLSDTWTYDGVSWAQSTATGPSPRDGHVMASLGSTVMLFGGLGASAALSDTWTFDGTSWNQVTGAGPPARYQSAAATLFTEAVVFGGRSNGAGDAGTAGLLDDTWTFDGASWAPVTGVAPAARSGYAMGQATGTLGPEVFLFGGVGVGGPLGDAWKFNNAWSSLEAMGPTPRVGHAVAALGPQLVLFGGYDPTAGASLDDTWIFNGESWTASPILGPPARYGHAMATLHGRIVLFGGIDTGAPFDDTWTFDGTSWIQLEGAGPPARSGHAMAALP